jgi:hypothetical protein
MASTYSALKIELIGTGEQSGTWGTTTNNNLGNDALGEAITGSADVAFSSADVTVTLTDTNASQAARNLRLNLTGTSGGARQLILGAGCQIEKLYLINNGLADAVTVKNTGGTGIAVPAGKSMFVFNNGTNVVDAVTHLSSLTLGSALPIASGGTGSTSTTFVNAATNITGTLPITNGGTGQTTQQTAINALAGAQTNNRVLRSDGTNTTLAQVNVATDVTGTLPIANGGTGTTSTTFANLTTNVTGTLPVTNGGTGLATLTANNVMLGNGTSTPSFVAPSTSGNVLTSNGTTWTSAALNFDKSFTANGWQKIPGGLILQWGESSFINSDSSVSVTFPIAFTTSCFQVIVSGTAGVSGPGEVALGSIDLTTTTVTIVNDGGKGSTARWFAIGY